MTIKVNKKLNILIVDKDSSNIQLLTSALSSSYEIFTANDGYRALEIIMTFNIDVVLLDLILPHLDGYEILRIIRKYLAEKNLMVIVLTNFPSSEFQSEWLLPKDKAMEKPIKIGKLKIFLENIHHQKISNEC